MAKLIPPAGTFSAEGGWNGGAAPAGAVVACVTTGNGAAVLGAPNGGRGHSALGLWPRPAPYPAPGQHWEPQTMTIGGIGGYGGYGGIGGIGG
jgi:hypothetical protein